MQLIPMVTIRYRRASDGARLAGHSTNQFVALAARFHRRHPGTPIDAARLTLRVLARR